MQTTNNRLAKLRDAQAVAAELEKHVDTPEPGLQRIKGDLEEAGRSIRSAGFTRHMEDAMGRAAGMATTRGLDDLVDRATRVLDGEVELSADPETVVETGTDDRGRVTLGREFANQRVEVAVLSAERPDDGTEETDVDE